LNFLENSYFESKEEDIMYGVDEYIRDCHTAQYGIGEEKKRSGIKKETI
jgi:hypothetical protein